MVRSQIKAWLQSAEDSIKEGWNSHALYQLNYALEWARKLPADVPRNRCLRAYIAQAIGALT